MGRIVDDAHMRTDFARSGPRGRLTLGDVARVGFVLLGARPEREIAFGIAGKFWTPSGGRLALDADAFILMLRAIAREATR